MRDKQDDGYYYYKNANDDKVVKVTSIDELEEIVTTDAENTVADLQAKHEALAAKYDTYEKYTKGVSEVETYYVTVLEETHQLC